MKKRIYIVFIILFAISIGVALLSSPNKQEKMIDDVLSKIYTSSNTTIIEDNDDFEKMGLKQRNTYSKYFTESGLNEAIANRVLLSTDISVISYGLQQVSCKNIDITKTYNPNEYNYIVLLDVVLNDSTHVEAKCNGLIRFLDSESMLIDKIIEFSNIKNDIDVYKN